MPPLACIAGAAACEGGPQPSLRWRWNRSILFQSVSGGPGGSECTKYTRSSPGKGSRREAFCYTLYGRSKRGCTGAVRHAASEASQGAGQLREKSGPRTGRQPSVARLVARPGLDQGASVASEQLSPIGAALSGAECAKRSSGSRWAKLRGAAAALSRSCHDKPTKGNFYDTS